MLTCNPEIATLRSRTASGRSYNIIGTRGGVADIAQDGVNLGRLESDRLEIDVQFEETT